jgi:hypothetical protein
MLSALLQMKALRGDGYSAIREAKGVIDNINLLEKKVCREHVAVCVLMWFLFHFVHVSSYQAVKLAGIIKDKDSSLESYKMAEKDMKRTERNTAALIAASTAPDPFAAVAERIQTMVRGVAQVNASPGCASSFRAECSCFPGERNVCERC